jgi:hypothetical protein
LFGNTSSSVSNLKLSFSQLKDPMLSPAEIEGIRLAKLEEMIKYLEYKYDGASTDSMIIDTIIKYNCFI